jgi:hypothetical protein
VHFYALDWLAPPDAQLQARSDQGERRGALEPLAGSAAAPCAADVRRWLENDSKVLRFFAAYNTGTHSSAGQVSAQARAWTHADLHHLKSANTAVCAQALLMSWPSTAESASSLLAHVRAQVENPHTRRAATHACVFARPQASPQAITAAAGRNSALAALTGGSGGELVPLTVHYYLADGTIEVVERLPKKGGKDPFPRLLQRRKLPRSLPAVGAHAAQLLAPLAVQWRVGRLALWCLCDRTHSQKHPRQLLTHSSTPPPTQAAALQARGQCQQAAKKVLVRAAASTVRTTSTLAPSSTCVSRS